MAILQPSARMDDGDEYFDLDDLEYASEFAENERASLAPR